MPKLAGEKSITEFGSAFSEDGGDNRTERLPMMDSMGDADEIVFLKIKPICGTSVQIPEIRNNRK